MKTWKELTETEGLEPQYITLTVAMPHVQGNVDVTGLLIDERIDAKSLPEGWHLYSLRHTDGDWCVPATIELGVLCNFMGCLLLDHELPIKDGNDVIEVVDYNYRDWEDVAQEVLEEYGLADYIDYWEDLKPIAENIKDISKIITGSPIIVTYKYE